MVEKKKDANKAKVAREISKIWGGLESDQIATLKEHVEITKYKKGEMIYQCDETPTERARLSASSNRTNSSDSVLILQTKSTRLQPRLWILAP